MIFLVRVSILLLAGILIGCSHSTKTLPELTKMTDQWHFFPCAMGDKQAFIFLNTSIADKINSAPTSLARLTLSYKSPSENGLPTGEEFDSVSAIEDRIEAFAEKSNDWYVGRVTVEGRRYFYVYTSKDEPSWMEFTNGLGTKSGYDIRLSYRDDPDHRGYHDDLYPTDDDWRVIKDLQVIESLERYGDDGSEPRRVDHWIYFEDKLSSVDFVIWAESARFTIDSEHSYSTDDGEYCVRLFHHGTVKIGDISSHTIALRRKAAEHGGVYDGWETQVIEPE
jgi:hypothetical protein